MKIRCSVGGKYQLIVRDQYGNVKRQTPLFANVITDGGMNRMATDQYLTYCQVGSGNAAPAFTDSALESFIASSSTVTQTDFIVEDETPKHIYRDNTYHFVAGAAEGEIAEVGVGWAMSGSLFSRALVVDHLGNPTTIEVGPTDILDVVYQLFIFVQENDVTGEVDLRGDIYTWTVRLANFKTGSIFESWLLSRFGTYAGEVLDTEFNFAYDGPLGTIYEIPTGTEANPLSFLPTAYVVDSHQLTFEMIFTISNGNLEAGVSAFSFKAGWGFWQVGFDPPIPKTEEDEFQLLPTLSWSRS